MLADSYVEMGSNTNAGQAPAKGTWLADTKAFLVGPLSITLFSLSGAAVGMFEGYRDAACETQVAWMRGAFTLAVGVPFGLFSAISALQAIKRIMGMDTHRLADGEACAKIGHSTAQFFVGFGALFMVGSMLFCFAGDSLTTETGDISALEKACFCADKGKSTTFITNAALSLFKMAVFSVCANLYYRFSGAQAQHDSDRKIIQHAGQETKGYKQQALELFSQNMFWNTATVVPLDPNAEKLATKRQYLGELKSSGTISEEQYNRALDAFTELSQQA